MTPVGALLAARFPSRFPAWHRQIYRYTRGVIGHRWTGYLCLLLTTTGRVSGELRRTVLTYVEVGGVLYVAASNGGSSQPPAWLRNAVARPAVHVRVGRSTWCAEASVVDPATDEFAAAWTALNIRRAGKYDEYQRRTNRQIPIVALRRDGPRSTNQGEGS